MAKEIQTKPSLYKGEIKTVNITNIFTNILIKLFKSNQTTQIKLDSDFIMKVKKTYEEIDFQNRAFNIIWTGIFSNDSFYALFKFGEEKEVLNIIKEQHLNLIIKDNNIIVCFINPIASPFYRFFYKNKNTGYHEDITEAINTLLSKFESYFYQEFLLNFQKYGYWLD